MKAEFRHRLLALLAALSLLPFAGNAQNVPGATGDSAITERVDAALLELAERGELPRGPNAAPIEISRAAREAYDLGAVIDLGGEGPGATVLGVTPGGGAEGIGLRPGDRLLGINGLRLDPRAITAVAIREVIAGASGAVEAEVLRDGETLSLRGHALPVSLPAYRLTVEPLPGGCGRISTATLMPRTLGLFPIGLRRIDGIEQARGLPVYRVTAGPHTLMLREGIPSVELNSVESNQRTQLRQRRMAEYKFLEIDVQPDTTYYLAARLSPYSRDVVNNAHWEPVIWQVKPERCR